MAFRLYHVFFFLSSPIVSIPRVFELCSFRQSCQMWQRNITKFNEGWDENIYPFPNFNVAALKIGIAYSILLHTLLNMWLLIVRLNLIHAETLKSELRRDSKLWFHIWLGRVLYMNNAFQNCVISFIVTLATCKRGSWWSWSPWKSGDGDQGYISTTLAKSILKWIRCISWRRVDYLVKNHVNNCTYHVVVNQIKRRLTPQFRCSYSGMAFEREWYNLQK